jgi:hypothetical protein
MSKKHRSRPHLHTDVIHSQVSDRAPIVPQRDEAVEAGRQRVNQTRGRVGQRQDRELYQAQFPIL